MSVRLDCGACTSGVRYGRSAGVNVLEMDCGEILTPSIDFSDGCNPCNAPCVTYAQVDCPEPKVYANGGLGAEITDFDGSEVFIQIDATHAVAGEVYHIHVRADLDGCDRMIEKFKVKIKGGC